MKSTEFYKVLNSLLAERFFNAGFERVRSATSFWHLRLDRKHLFYQILVAITTKYDPCLGGEFLIRVNLLRKYNPYQVGMEEGMVSYMQYFSKKDLEEMKGIRDGVINNLLAQTEFENEFEHMMFKTFEPLWKSGLGVPFRRDCVLGLPYLDTEDITAWGNFLAKNIGKTVKGIRNRPMFMR
ncbi:MAG: hypothetical protein ACJ8FY_15365 [Gemmataceae bacterium]